MEGNLFLVKKVSCLLFTRENRPTLIEKFQA